MSRVVLVRHAMPQEQPGVAASRWGLSETAREDCVLLAHHLAMPSGGHVHSSPERRASETADVLALRLGRFVRLDTDLREVDRPTAWEDDYRVRVSLYLAGEHHAGWEPPQRVVERFSLAVERAIASATESGALIVSHGQAIALYVGSLVPVDVVAFWQALTLPDAWVLDLDSRALTRLFPAGLPPG